MDLPVVDDLAEWTTIAGPSQELLVGQLLGPDLFAAKLNRDGGYAVGLFRPGQQTEVLVEPGAMVQEVYLVGDAVVYAVADEATGEFRIFRWDGVSPEAEVVYESVGVDALWSETAVSGSTMFLTVREGGLICVDQMDLAQPDPSTDLVQLWCQDETGPPWWLQVHDSTFSFFSSGADTPCATVHRVVLPGTTVEEVDVPGCVSRGFVTGDTVVWSEPPADDPQGEDWAFTQLRALVDGEVVELGITPSGSQTTCDGTFYWRRDEPGAGNADEIRRWRPGDENVQVIYRSPVGADMTMDYILSIPMCVGDMVSIERFGMWANSGEEILVTPGWDWAADLLPAAPRPT